MFVLDTNIEKKLIALFGFKTTLDDIFRAGNLQIDEEGVVVEIIGLANKAMLDVDATKTTVVFREHGKSEVLSQSFPEFIRHHVPHTKKFSLWLGAYQATGDFVPPHVTGEQMARTFDEAVMLFYKEKNALDSIFYWKGVWSLNGYGPFYTNGEDARR